MDEVELALPKMLAKQTQNFLFEVNVARPVEGHIRRPAQRAAASQQLPDFEHRLRDKFVVDEDEVGSQREFAL